MRTKRDLIEWAKVTLLVAFAVFATTGFTFAGQDTPAAIRADHTVCEQALADPSFTTLDHLEGECLFAATDQLEREIGWGASSLTDYAVEFSAGNAFDAAFFEEEWTVDQFEREIDAGFLSPAAGLY